MGPLACQRFPGRSPRRRPHPKRRPLLWRQCVDFLIGSVDWPRDHPLAAEAPRPYCACSARHPRGATLRKLAPTNSILVNRQKKHFAVADRGDSSANRSRRNRGPNHRRQQARRQRHRIKNRTKTAFGPARPAIPRAAGVSSREGGSNAKRTAIPATTRKGPASCRDLRERGRC